MKIIKFGKEAREAVGRGIDFAVRCVALSYGPAGRNAMIGRHGLTPEDTNDGVTIAMNVEVEDETEQLGVLGVRRVTMDADLEGGDGTTASAILYGAIKKAAFERLADSGAIGSKKVNTVAIAKEITAAAADVVARLKASARPIDVKEIYNVAMTSGEYEWIAKILDAVYSKIGKDGFVSIEDGTQTGFDIYRGIEINAGYLSEYFINNDKRQCVINGARILVTNQRLDSETIVPFITSLTAENPPINNLIMVAPDFDKELLNRLNATKIEGKHTNYIAVKYPTYDKDDILKDISALSGAKFLDKNAFATIDDYKKSLTIANMGSFDQTIVSDRNTVFLGGTGDVAERVESLRGQIAQTISIFDKSKLEQRLAFLSGGVAVVRIDINSDSGKYFRKKMEDAINTVQLALKNGVVKGGGLALKEIGESMPKESILAAPLRKPNEQLNENAGETLIIGDDVIDAVDVVISSVRAACNKAVTLVMTELSIADKEEDNTKNHDHP